MKRANAPAAQWLRSLPIARAWLPTSSGHRDSNGMPKRRLACLVAVLAVRLAWADVTDATVEQTSPHRYHLTFHAEPVGGPVSIFASHTPSNREDEKPVAMTSGGSSDVHLHGWTGRPYFHLTTPGGKTRVVSIRRLPLEGQNNFRDLGGYRTTDGRYTRWGR